MHSLSGQLICSATDLSKYLACQHLSLLDADAAQGRRSGPPKYDDPGLKVVQARGLEHEHKYLSSLKASKSGTGKDLQIADLSTGFGGPPSLQLYQRRHAATIAAMQAGADVIYQGCLFDGRWLGYPDFLLKVDRPSSLGSWSYEVADTKLAREAKAGALLQVLLYADLVGVVQGAAPEFVHLVLGGPARPKESFKVNHYSAYYRAVKKRFEEWVGVPRDIPTAVDPVSHCDQCNWHSTCERERRAVDHLSFVAGISRSQRTALVAAGVGTLESLASLTTEKLPRIADIKPGPLARIHSQALIQLKGRRSGQPIHELLQPVEANRGLAALPAPSPGDLFFDLEGDPYVFDCGLEYLFGLTDANGNYTGRWSLIQSDEKATFEWFIDLVTARRQTHPDLHIYHFAPYEPSALKRLAGRYGTRIDELDALLKEQVFVDLYRVVRQGVRASVESYSIKKLEKFYDFKRAVDLKEAGDALANFEAWLQLGGQSEGAGFLLDQIEGYNQDDCVSTLHLRGWLESLRVELERITGSAVPRPSPAEPEDRPEQTEKVLAVRELMDRLTDGVQENREERSAEQQGRWLLAQMLEYHRREGKTFWWQYFAWRDMTVEQLLEESSPLADLEYRGIVGEVDRSVIHRYQFPAQDYKIKVGSKPRDPVTEKSAGEVVALDEIARTIDLKRSKTSKVPHPESLIPFDWVNDEEQRGSLQRLAHQTLAHGFVESAPIDLLLHRPPRVKGGALMNPGESRLDAALRLATSLDRSVLPIQGPPGTGKTYTGARMILALLKAGKKVGVTATSHKVIGNLLKEVCKAAEEAKFQIRGIQKADEDDWCGHDQVLSTKDNGAVVRALSSGEAHLAAGTAWLWSREEMIDSVDVLFIDEAGQFALANALAVAPAAKSLVLLGDPRQLQQPQQGHHPPGADLSALDHLLNGKETMPVDRGLFLDQTWRLHPSICRFTSEVYYEDRLEPQPDLALQQLNGTGAPAGHGLLALSMNHSDHDSQSPEEVKAIVELVDRILKAKLTWTDRKQVVRSVGLGDILIVSPYNAQVIAIRQALPGANVGTVDKFQGQEAPIVVYSMATSSPEDAPRGMPFLYSPNRLNVATSRARCLVILVASNRLYFPQCQTPEQMRLANGLCRYLELSSPVAQP